MATKNFLSQELHPNPQTEAEIQTERSRKARPFLHSDIITNILSRLPVKPVGRFRCVSKQWRLLTYDPYFLNLQYERGSTHKLYRKCRDTRSILSYDFKPEDCTQLEKSYSKVNLDLTCHRFSNCIRGLTCSFTGCHLLSSGGVHSDIYILNPTTGEHMKLPAPLRAETQHKRDFCILESFDLGIDESTGEFKVLRLSSFRNNPLCCEILTVGTGQWRCLGEVPSQHMSSSAVYLNGRLHWISVNSYSESQKSLLTFDIKKETFGPRIAFPSMCCCLSLGEYGGRLCVLTRSNGNLFVLWALRGYVNPKWIKEDSFYYHYMPIWFRDIIIIAEDKILFQYKERDGAIPNSYYYDLRRKTFNRFSDEKMDKFIIHKDSLISPISLLDTSHEGV